MKDFWINMEQTQKILGTTKIRSKFAFTIIVLQRIIRERDRRLTFWNSVEQIQNNLEQLLKS